MGTVRPACPDRKATCGRAAYTAPKSTTTEPEGSVRTETGATGCSLMWVRWA